MANLEIVLLLTVELWRIHAFNNIKIHASTDIDILFGKTKVGNI